MSLTPVDKPPDGEDTPDGTPSRRFPTVRAYVSRFFSWVTERVTSSAKERGDSGRNRRRQSRPATTTNSTPESTDAGERVAIANFPERDQPLTYPGRELQGINSPDVVGIETENGLRLSVPENPDATLTSDVWMSVEP